jgi:hypothetical protein
VMTFLREYRAPDIRGHLDFEYVMAFWRSIYLLGIRGVERAHYWRLVLWTLTHKPRLFPQAISFAIYGHHYRTVCNLQS